MNRRGFIRLGALFAAIPLADNFLMRTKLFANNNISKFSVDLVKNGEVITGAHWGILKATIKDSKVIKIENGVSGKSLNPLQGATKDLINSESRVRYPMVRKSYLKNPNNPKPELRGADEWVRVSYEDAIKLIANQLKKTYKEKGYEGVYAGSYGWSSPGRLHNCRVGLWRMLNLAGGFVGSTGDYSTGASQIIMPHVLGTIEVYEQQTSWPVVMDNSKVVVIWGANPLATLRIAWGITDQEGIEYLKALVTSGKKLIHIDPVYNETAKMLGAQWIAPVPNTDVPLMLGIAHTMYKNNKYDKDFIENYTTGFDKFEAYLTGKSDGIVKDSKWASSITRIDAKVIEELASTFFDNRTMLMSGWAMQRQHHGEQPHWMLVTLASMIGQIGLPGGGFGLSYHYSNGGVPTAKAYIPSGITAGASSGGAAWLENAAKASIPVARIADMLLNPGKTIEMNGSKVTYSDIDFIYWAGGNPMVHHQDTNTLIKAWRKPRTIVVNEQYWTPTARFADIVMPVTTTYERNDIALSGDYSNLNFVPMKQLVEKQYEAKDDLQVYTDIAKEFGVAEKFTEGKDEIQWLEEFYNVALQQSKANATPELAIKFPKFKEFWKENKPITFIVPQESIEFIRYKDFREDPILSPLGTPSGLIEIYSEVIEKMNYEDCPAHPTWMEPIEWLGMKNKPAKYHMISSHPVDRLHSQLNNTSLREKYAVNGREPIWINSKDAKAEGIKNGDLVRVFNARGQVLAGAIVTNDIMQGVVRLSEGAWYDPQNSGKIGSICRNGNANVLTIDLPTSKLANGNISHTALVNIEKFKGKTQRVEVFKQPKKMKV